MTLLNFYKSMKDNKLTILLQGLFWKSSEEFFQTPVELMYAMRFVMHKDTLSGNIVDISSFELF